eukprot:UN13881
MKREVKKIVCFTIFLIIFTAALTAQIFQKSVSVVEGTICNQI